MIFKCWQNLAHGELMVGVITPVSAKTPSTDTLIKQSQFEKYFQLVQDPLQILGQAG